ncbi:MAG: hypothetical protein FJ109_00080 [Deltaproteobacteria bacterium]|nr:hypothetical protein [Deltaproteobacteria bacterium]
MVRKKYMSTKALAGWHAVVAVTAALLLAGSCTSRAEKCARIDALCCAELVAASAPDPLWHPLLGVAVGYSEAGRYDDALRLARECNRDQWVLLALTDIAREMASGGAAQSVLEETVEYALEQAMETPDYSDLKPPTAALNAAIQATSVVRLASLLPAVGRQDEVSAAVRHSEGLIEMLEEAWGKALASCMVGATMWEEGFMEPARRMRDVCMGLNSRSTGPEFPQLAKESLFVTNAEKWGTAGHPEWAREFLDAAEDCDDDGSLVRGMSESVAQAFAKAGLLDESEEWMARIPGAAGQVRVLVAMGKKLASLDRHEDAALLVPRIESLIREARDDLAVDDVGCGELRASIELAELLLLLDEAGRARDLVASALERTGNKPGCGAMLEVVVTVQVAELLAATGDFLAALETAESIRDNAPNLSGVLARIGVQAARQGHTLTSDETAVLGRIVDRLEKDDVRK